MCVSYFVGPPQSCPYAVFLPSQREQLVLVSFRSLEKIALATKCRTMLCTLNDFSNDGKIDTSRFENDVLFFQPFLNFYSESTFGACRQVENQLRQHYLFLVGRICNSELWTYVLVLIVGMESSSLQVLI